MSIDETVRSEDSLRREITELREELDLITGGWQARVVARARLNAELERLRTEVGTGRRQRRELRDQLDEAQREINRLRKDRIRLRDQLKDSPLRIDGQLLTDLIINSCPVMLTDATAADIARDTVDELARVGPGVTVFRGHPDTPWLLREFSAAATSGCDSPNRAAESATYTDGCRNGCAPAPADERVDTTICDDPDDADRDVQYAVCIGPKSPDQPFRVTQTSNLDVAQLLATHLPDSWVAQRVVITPRWTPLDTEDPMR